MTNNLCFFTAVHYGENKNPIQSILEGVDNYFYLGGKKAHVIQGKTKQGREKAILVDTKSSVLEKIGKIATYFTIIIPLVMLITKAILRSTHNFKLIDPKKKLEKGIDISTETALKIQGLMSKILSIEENDKEIKWLSTGNNLVFQLEGNSELVFKIPRQNCYGKGKLPTGNSEKQTSERYENMVKSKAVCVANQLGLLVIPQAKKFTIEAEGNVYHFIAEKSLELNGNESFQEHLYYTHSTELKETVRQLAIFVAKSGFNDVTWRNIPVLNEKQEDNGARRVGLIDLEHMKNAVNGFQGDWNGSRGLIRCAGSVEQIDAIIEEARNQGVSLNTEEFQRLKQQRIDELKADEQLQAYYIDKGIVNGKEPIHDVVDSLGLNLDEEGEITMYVKDEKALNGFRSEKQTVTLRKAAENVIEQINRQIQASSDMASVKGKRYFIFKDSDSLFSQYRYMSIPGDNSIIENSDDQRRWLKRIIEALVEKGCLFRFNDNGQYFIQA